MANMRFCSNYEICPELNLEANLHSYASFALSLFRLRGNVHVKINDPERFQQMPQEDSATISMHITTKFIPTNCKHLVSLVKILASHAKNKNDIHVLGFQMILRILRRGEISVLLLATSAL